MKAAVYDRYGPPEVIELVDLDIPEELAADEVLVQVIAVGINPVDSKARRGRLPIKPFPTGIGREFSGIVVAAGPSVSHVMIGQNVVGTGENVARERVAVPGHLVMPMPEGLTWDQAAVLPVAAQTAWRAVDSQDPLPGSIAVVSGAAGGVGHLVCQLLVERGVTVVGLARGHNHEYLESLGVIPVESGEGMTQRLVEATPQGIHHFFDHTGAEAIELALALGVPRENINSVSGVGSMYGVPTVGREGLDPAIIEALSERVATGSLSIPITVFPWDQIRKAFIYLEEASRRGRVVVRFDAEPEDEL